MVLGDNMNIIDLLKTLLLGLVEGITEWLPISSTGHMILLDEWIQLNVSPDFKEMFFVVIQLGAILAVVLLFFNKLNPLSFKKDKEEKIAILWIWAKVIVGVLPAAIFGLLLDDILNDLLYNFVTVISMLILYGIIFIVVEVRKKDTIFKVNTMDELTFKHALYIGLFQVLSLVPGTSRSGATIIGGMLVGTSRVIAAEFSFYLSIPVMFGASALKLYKFGFDFTQSELIILLTGMVTAFIVSIIAIKFLLQYIKKHDFKVFGYYRIALGFVLFLYIIF
jgi:undecaprenyl-diphosphatase